MKFTKIELPRMRNEEHFQFHSETKALIERYDLNVLKILAEFSAYSNLLNVEDEALEVIRKSIHTEAIAEADRKRDELIIGLFATVRAATYHYVPAMAKAAREMTVLIDQYRDMPRLGMKEETASVHNFLQSCRGEFAAQVSALQLQSWLSELESSNNAVIALTEDRYTELAAKSDVKMKAARKDTDDAYRAIIEKIEALQVIEGEAAYLPFVKEQNERINKFKQIMAQRSGSSGVKGKE